MSTSHTYILTDGWIQLVIEQMLDCIYNGPKIFWIEPSTYSLKGALVVNWPSTGPPESWCVLNKRVCMCIWLLPPKFKFSCPLLLSFSFPFLPLPFLSLFFPSLPFPLLPFPSHPFPSFLFWRKEIRDSGEDPAPPPRTPALITLSDGEIIIL